LPSKGRGINVQTHGLIKGIYEVHILNGLKCYDINTKLIRGYTDTQTACGGVSILLLFQEKKSRLKPTDQVAVIKRMFELSG
jgi:hypothetical protein